MGCDIYLHQEVKIHGAWHHYGIADVKRNYWLFSRMANVRNSERRIEPIGMHEGVPYDATFITQYDYKIYNSDAHTPGWLDRDQIIVLMQELNVRDARSWEWGFGYCFGNGWENPERPEIQDIRFIFWFDN